MNQSAPSVTAEQSRGLYDCLQRHAHGHDNAKTARWLVEKLGLPASTGDRVLRALANAATESGFIVCTGNAGYWIPATPEEAEETIGRLQSQGVQMIERAKQLRALVDKHFSKTESASRNVQLSLV